MRPIVLLIAVLACFGLAFPASAQEAQWAAKSSFAEWADELSFARIVEKARTVKVTYAGPTGSFVARTGVKPGTLLFKGVHRGPFVNGTAYFFRSGCPPVPYHMHGNLEQGVLSLRGSAPIIRDRVSCAVLKYDRSLSNANLTFVRQ